MNHYYRRDSGRDTLLRMTGHRWTQTITLTLGLMIGACTAKPPAITASQAPRPTSVAASTAEARGAVSGRILDEHGRPVADVIVAVEHEAQLVISDMHGTFLVPDAPLRGYLIVSKRGYLTALVSLVSFAEDRNEIVLLPES